MDRHTIFMTIRQNRKELKDNGLERIGLFGSYSRNDQTENSDIDLILEFSQGKKNIDNYMRIYDILERLLNKSLDILTPESISPYLKEYIEKDVIYEEL